MIKVYIVVIGYVFNLQRKIIDMICLYVVVIGTVKF